MKAKITDAALLSDVTPSQISSYLMTKNAHSVGSYADKAAIWRYGQEEILVPYHRRFADYVQRVSQIIEALASLENRSEPEILSDFFNSGFDIIRIRNMSADAREGTINFEQSIHFMSQSREMLMAAACSAASGKLYYHGPKPHNAEEFMRTVRFGQTERGSFVLQLLAPVRPMLKEQGTLLDMPEKESYDRRVVPTLMSGLDALNTAARSIILDGEISHFTSQTKNGLTTNLCDAVVSMYEALQSESIEISTTYSLNRTHRYIDSKVNIDKGDIPVLKETSDVLKIREIDDDVPVMIRGPIIEMHSEEPASGGEIIVRNLMDRKPRNIRLMLDGEDYLKSVEAHKKQFFLEADGIMASSGQGARPRLDQISSIKFFNPVEDAH